MKKLLACVISLVLLCSVLCGCGDDGVDDNIIVSPQVTAGVSPSATAGIDDGIVDDKDGVIGDNDNGRDKNGVLDDGILDDNNNGREPAAQGSAAVSPVPTATAKP